MLASPAHSSTASAASMDPNVMSANLDTSSPLQQLVYYAPICTAQAVLYVIR